MLIAHAPRLACADASKTAETPILPLPIKGAELADFLGIAVETLSRQFSSINKDGIIRSHGNGMIKVLKPLPGSG